MTKTFLRITPFLCVVLSATAPAAQDVRISTFKSESTFSLNGRTFTVTRDQNQRATLPPEHTLTSRACPPDCVQPMTVAQGVATLGELELLRYLETTMTDGQGLLVDTRDPQPFGQTAIPSAVNIPVGTLAPDNRFRNDILRALGGIDRADGSLDLSNAMQLALYGDGVWSSDASTAIKHLLEAGYPPEKLHFYRGGMQAWLHLGLTTLQSQNPG